MGLLDSVQKAIGYKKTLMEWTEPNWVKLRLSGNAAARIAAGVAVGMGLSGVSLLVLLVAQPSGGLAAAIFGFMVVSFAIGALIPTWGERFNAKVFIRDTQIERFQSNFYGGLDGGVFKISVEQWPNAAISHCKLIPYGVSNQPFSLLYLRLKSDRDDVAIGIPPNVEMRHVALCLGSQGIQVNSPVAELELLAVRAQQTHDPAVQAALAKVAGDNRAVHGPMAVFKSLAMCAAIAVGVFVLLIGGLVVFFQMKRGRQEVAAQPVPQPRPRAVASSSVPKPVNPPATQPVAPPATPAGSNQPVAGGGTNSPSNSRELAKAPDLIHRLAISGDGRRVFAAGHQQVYVIDPERNETVGRYSEHKPGILGVVLAAERPIAASYGGTEVHVWNVDDLKSLARFPVEIAAGNCALSPDGERLAHSNILGHVQVVDVKTQKPISHPDIKESGLSCLAFSSDGQQLIVVARAAVKIFSLSPSGKMQTIESSLPSITKSSLTADGAFAAFAGLGAIETWSLSDGKRMASIPITGLAGDVAIGPGPRLYYATDAAVAVCDVRTGQEVTRLKGHKIAVTNLALSGNGRRLITVSNWDRTMRSWDLAP